MAPKQHTCFIAGGIALEHGACITSWKRCYRLIDGKRLYFWFGSAVSVTGQSVGSVKVMPAQRGYNLFSWISAGEIA